MNANVDDLIGELEPEAAEDGVDLEEAQRFLDRLAGGEKVTFQTFDERRGEKDGSLSRVLHGKLEKHADTLEELNARGAGVFVMVNRGDCKGRAASNVTGVRALFVDLDGAPLQPVLDSTLTPHLVVESSAGRYHAYWLVEDCSLEAFGDLQAALAKLYGGDTHVRDLPRVMRLPGFIHRKGGGEPFRTRLLQDNIHLPYTVAEVLDRTGISIARVADVADAATGMPLGGSRNALAGFSEGQRDDGLFRYACSLRARRTPRDEARMLVMESARACTPPMPEIEALKCLEQAWKYPEGMDAPEENLTDVGNAMELVRRFGEDMRYVQAWGKWLLWDGGCWRVDEGDGIVRLAVAVAQGWSDRAQAALERGDAVTSRRLFLHAKQSQGIGRIDAMTRLAQSEPSVRVSAEALDADPWLLGCANGVLNLRTGALSTGRREDYVTQRSPVAFDAEAECPVFEDFLSGIMDGDREMIAFVRRAVGYSLTGDVSEQCLFLLHGGGANGKSTLLAALQDILGDHATECQTEMLLANGRESSGTSNGMARLRGSRLVVATETEDNRRFSESTVKQLTGGDRVTARFLYSEFFSFRPTFKLWLATNHRPNIRGGHAIWRRIRLIPFGVQIPEEEQDRQLGAKLRAEYPGILAWALRGCREWQMTGLHPPKGVTEATEEYREEMDVFGKWMRECCTLDAPLKAKATALYESYRGWCSANGAYVVSGTAFGIALRERGFRKIRSNGYVYSGIALQEEAPF